MPRFAVMTFMYGRRLEDGSLSHRQLLEAIADHGADGIEVFHRTFRGENRGLLREYQHLLAELGLKMAAIDVITDLVSGGPGARRAGRDELRRGLDICLALEAPIAHVAGSRLGEQMSPEDGRKILAEALLEVADLAEYRGLTLAVEDFDPAPEFLCRLDDVLDLLRRTRFRVKMVFDTGNFFAVGERADENLAAAYEHIVLCHFKDFLPADGPPGSRRGTHFGQGVIPNRRVARMLVERGYSGWVALESYPQPGMQPEATIAEELARLREMFAAESGDGTPPNRPPEGAER